ncbi:MAG TPA: hypothetical protein VFY84_04720 [Jiangellales bacterium]|nr:hypothetical protein [Jiangellales bacterium]
MLADLVSLDTDPDPDAATLAARLSPWTADNRAPWAGGMKTERRRVRVVLRHRW